MTEDAPEYEGQRSCRKCGRIIRFAVGPNGKPIPLSRVKTVYTVNAEENAVPFGVGTDLWISHFVDCPHAAHFSRGGR